MVICKAELLGDLVVRKAGIAEGLDLKPFIAAKIRVLESIKRYNKSFSYCKVVKVVMFWLKINGRVRRVGTSRGVESLLAMTFAGT